LTYLRIFRSILINEMILNDEQKTAVRELGNAINSVVESSKDVRLALENIRNLGLEPNLRLKLDLQLYKTDHQTNEPDEIKLEFTEQDLQTLRGMKISIDDLD
jgi:transcription antitermination factor NusG